MKCSLLDRLCLIGLAAISCMGADQSVRQAQEALKSKGYYQDSIDGAYGPKTRSALLQYQKAEGLQSTGRLDNETAKRLNVPPTDSSGVKGAAKEAKHAVTSDTVKGATSDASSSTKSGIKGAMGEIKGTLG
jgi:peptidoglycan hydrolase-like protein with peptidoglycan-binding domain